MAAARATDCHILVSSTIRLADAAKIAFGKLLSAWGISDAPPDTPQLAPLRMLSTTKTNSAQLNPASDFDVVWELASLLEYLGRISAMP
mmetsp:Transcript_5485/g.20015  ORF Transcript_5485/g.20015 Transcript_5485/m.20015 type:complete len:89 (-) Transcript_5485:1301-1567(-)|eukprot:scaffold1338_cov364-Prasinococcus_capsulatus_cf.AAC.3